jgi:REP element-mobilizing transposase RayT
VAAALAAVSGVAKLHTVRREGDGVIFRRNQLPQWRLDGGVYFVTWRLHRRGDELSPAERTLVAEAIRRDHEVRYYLSIFVVMHDHVHVLLQTLPGHDLSDILQRWKGTTALVINRLRQTSGIRWQKASRTDLMRNDAALLSRREYIYDNPRRKWNSPPEEYEWLEWFH